MENVNSSVGIDKQEDWISQIWNGSKQLFKGAVRALPQVTSIALPIIFAASLPCVAGASEEEHSQTSLAAISSTTVGFLQTGSVIALQTMFLVAALGAAVRANPAPAVLTDNTCDRFAFSQIKSDLYTLADEIESDATYEEDSDARLNVLYTNLQDKLPIYHHLDRDFSSRAKMLERFDIALDYFLQKKIKKLSFERLVQYNQTFQIITQLLGSSPAISQIMDDSNNGYIARNCFKFSMETNFTQNAFRLVTVDMQEQKTIISKLERDQASNGLSTFITLQNDLKRFLVSYDQELTDLNKQIIKNMSRVFERAIQTKKTLLKSQLIFINFNDKFSEDFFLEEKLKFIKTVKDSIDLLNIGDFYLFPGGYNNGINKSAGHLVLYVIKKVGENDFRFTIINTGEGVFSLFISKFRDRSQTKTIDFFNISKEIITDGQFLYDLWSTNKEKTAMDIVYFDIHNFFKQKHQRSVEFGKAYTMQTWGTCSYSPMEVFLEHNFPDSLFTFFRYAMQLQAKVEMNQLAPKLKMDADVLELIDKKSCEAIEKQKYKLEELCWSIAHEMMIAKILNIQGMNDQEDLKRALRAWIDRHYLESKKFTEDRMCSEEFVDVIMRMFESVFGSFADQEKCILRKDYEPYEARKKFLSEVFELIEETAPNAAPFLSHDENIISFDDEIDLKDTFEHLQAQIRDQNHLNAMCVSLRQDPRLADIVPGCPNLEGFEDSIDQEVDWNHLQAP